MFRKIPNGFTLFFTMSNCLTDLCSLTCDLNVWLKERLRFCLIGGISNKFTHKLPFQGKIVSARGPNDFRWDLVNLNQIWHCYEPNPFWSVLTRPILTRHLAISNFPAPFIWSYHRMLIVGNKTKLILWFLLL